MFTWVQAALASYIQSTHRSSTVECDCAGPMSWEGFVVSGMETLRSNEPVHTQSWRVTTLITFSAHERKSFDCFAVYFPSRYASVANTYEAPRRASFFGSLASCSCFIRAPIRTSMKSRRSPCFWRKVPSRSLSMAENAPFCACQDFEAEPKISAN